MTHEYLKGAQEQELTYRELKNMARTSLEHAFLPGASLWSDPVRSLQTECGRGVARLKGNHPSLR